MTELELPKTTNIFNLWLKQDEGNHDKVYRLEVTEKDGKFDVFALYGRRGSPLTMHVYAEGVGAYSANEIYFAKLKEKLRKGYQFIEEDVTTIGLFTTPTLKKMQV